MFGVVRPFWITTRSIPLFQILGWLFRFLDLLNLHFLFTPIFFRRWKCSRCIWRRRSSRKGGSQFVLLLSTTYSGGKISLFARNCSSPKLRSSCSIVESRASWIKIVSSFSHFLLNVFNLNWIVVLISFYCSVFCWTLPLHQFLSFFTNS